MKWHHVFLTLAGALFFALLVAGFLADLPVGSTVLFK